MSGRKLLAAALIVGFYLLHQDTWFWRVAEPLAFGFLPVGLTYHAIYTLACAGLMAVLIRIAWPAEVERDAEDQRP